MSDEQLKKENNALRKNNEKLTRVNEHLEEELERARKHATTAVAMAQHWRLKVAELRGEDVGGLDLRREVVPSNGRVPVVAPCPLCKKNAPGFIESGVRILSCPCVAPHAVAIRQT